MEYSKINKQLQLTSETWFRSRSGTVLTTLSRDHAKHRHDRTGCFRCTRVSTKQPQWTVCGKTKNRHRSCIKTNLPTTLLYWLCSGSKREVRKRNRKG